MTVPLLVTKFRGENQTECEVFKNADGVLTSLFKYGDATKVLETSTTMRYGTLATHWRGDIYAISPEVGIYKNTPPSTVATLVHSFTSPHTTTETCISWQTIFKDGKMQLFTGFWVSTNNGLHLIFIDEEGNITETGLISATTTTLAFQNGIYFGNKMFSMAIGTASRLEIIDPIAQSVYTSPVSNGLTHNQADLAVHNGELYGYTIDSTTTVGKGNALWKLSSAIPFVLHEWEAYQPTSNEFPSTGGQNCIFSDGENLIIVGYPEGTTTNEIAIYKVNFDIDGLVTGVTDITETVLGFTSVPNYELMRIYTSRDIESELGTIKILLHIGLFPAGISQVEGTSYHIYEWNGINQLATYKGLWGDLINFDFPNNHIGGGAKTFVNENELNLTITGIERTDGDINITYVIDGSAPPSGVAMSFMYNNMDDSPISPATISPVDNGIASGNYIANLSTGESGIFRWDIGADSIAPGDIPNVGAFLIRTA